MTARERVALVIHLLFLGSAIVLAFIGFRVEGWVGLVFWPLSTYVGWMVTIMVVAYLQGRPRSWRSIARSEGPHWVANWIVKNYKSGDSLYECALGFLEGRLSLENFLAVLDEAWVARRGCMERCAGQRFVDDGSLKERQERDDTSTSTARR